LRKPIVGRPSLDANVWRINPDFSWTNITQGLPERNVSAVRASTENRDRVFVTLTGYLAGSNTPHIFRSDDRGKTWQSIAGDMPNMAVNDLFALPGKRDSVLFAATDFGVYGSMNGGKHWERLGKGLPFVPVYDLEYNPKMRTLVAGTYARSIVTFPLDSLRYSGSVSISDPENTNQNALIVMPSPADNFIQVSVNQFDGSSGVELLIFDSKGKLVEQQKMGASGIFQERIMTNHYSSGVYYVMLRQSGKVLSHKKFVVQH
jgi:Secretion system C-terminal sorting domain